MKVSTNWLKDFVTLPPPLERIAEHLTMAGLEVKKIESISVQKEKDIIFEVEVTSNRPDWLSHLGVAREIAAVENLSLKIPEIEKAAARLAAPGWRVELKENEGCPYYTGVYMEGVNPVPTPDFMKARLEACGVRPVHFLVDVTNYVLFETGQPLHAFDADLLEGSEIRIRRAKAGETFTAINGRELKLEVGDLVIADARQAAALAGVMGGKNTEINVRTRNIFLESAYFNPRWVRKTSRRLGLSSDSSYRFERKVDPEGVDFARERAVALIRQYGKPRFVSAVLKAGDKPPAGCETVHLNFSDIAKKLGAPVKAHEAFSILTRLGMQVKKDSEEIWTISVPSFRPDIRQPVDLAEEIARIYGYDNIPETLPAKAPILLPKNPVIELEEKGRDFFSAAGFFETVTFSLISPAQAEPEDLARAVRVDNPRNQELTLLRPRFYPSLLGVVQKNIRQGARGGAFYEMANLYRLLPNKQTEETKSVGLALFGKWRQKNWLDAERDASFYDLKGAVDAFLEDSGVEAFEYAPEESGFLIRPGAQKISSGKAVLGIIGELDAGISGAWGIEDRVYYAELSLPRIAAAMKKGCRIFHEPSKYPSISRDIALVVPTSIKAGILHEQILKLGHGLIERVELFDLFTGGRVPKDRKNIAFHVIYQSHGKTLLADQIQKLHTEIADSLAKQFQATFQ
ncbi:MAG TPA: phenylalanine--tRNA ligase subunit beta [bacterium]|nr:phenylalanine--tRNA ligase subunit beta [bacterium]